MKKLLWICSLAIAVAACLTAQDTSATIGGTVLDPSSAGVANAKVTITNTDRNQVVREITTQTAGTYSAPLLPVGNYSIKVEAKGFKTETRTGIVLNVSDELNINISMQVGAVTETVEVKEQATQVELGTPASSTTITGTQVSELALNTRNYEQLVSLMPGVAIKANPTDELFVGNSSPSGFSAQIPYAVDGNRNSANNWTVDGADNMDRGANLTLMTFPSVDSIAEFKVERSLYTADTGRAGGAQINVVTKAGTARYHGSLYEFFRNDKLAADSWSNNAAKVNLQDTANPLNNCTTNFTATCHAKIPPLRWNDFGGTIGGPLPLGHWNKEKNRTFFFFSEEARRIHTYTTFNPSLPTTAMLQGNFALPVCITTTAGVCPTGAAPVTSIAPALWNANASAYIKDIFSKLALPASSITSQFFPLQNIFNSRQEIGRIDQNFGEKFTVWGKVENDAIPTVEPGGLFTGSTIPNGATTDTNSPGQSFVVHAIYSIRPTLLNEVSFNYSHSAIHAIPVGLTTKANSPDINPTEPFANTQGVVPTISLTGLTSIVGYGPYDERNRNWSWFDSVTWIKGRHTFKFGALFDRYNKSENAANQQGSFGFTNAGAPTGTTNYYQSWANFLLGNVASFSMPSTDITPDLWQWQTELYAQDDFKVTPRLTLYMGLRWSYFGQPTDSKGLLTNFDPALYNPANAPQINPATGNLVAGTGNNFAMNGIIVGGKNSPFGAGVTNSSYRAFAPRLGIAWDPFGTGTTSIRAGYGIYYDSPEVGRFETNIFGDPPSVQTVSLSNASFTNVGAGTLGVSLAPLVLTASQIPSNIPYTQQWNFDIQRRLPGDVMLDTAYVGSKGTHLEGIVDINQVAPGAALAAGLHTANGLTIFTSTDDPRINAIRPYLGFNAINTIETAFDSNYHSLQVSARKSFGAAGLLGFSYTWAKYMTDNGTDSSSAPQSSFNWHEGEYGLSLLDRKMVLAFNYVYIIPAFAHSHGIANKTLGGWELSGILSTYTGTPFTVTTSSVDPAGLGLLGSSASSARPDMVCDPNANAPHQYSGVTGAGPPRWFNTACFQPVPQGTVRPGNTGRNTVRGPGYFNLDTSLIKNFGLVKENRLNLQIRGEAFNVLNWVNPGTISSTNNTSASFGEISPTAFRAARRIQLAAKLIF
jgi:hypothetical protein